MHGHAMRGLVVIPALTALTILAAGCGSSGHASAPHTSHPAASSPTSASTGSAAATACHKIESTLAKAPSTLGKLALNPSSAKSDVNAFVTKLKTEADAAGNTTLSSAVDQFTSSVQKALSSLQSNPGNVTSLISQLTKDSQKIATACKNATG